MRRKGAGIFFRQTLLWFAVLSVKHAFSLRSFSLRSTVFAVAAAATAASTASVCCLLEEGKEGPVPDVDTAQARSPLAEQATAMPHVL